ncbi:MAG: hypothetical protein A4E57_04037 [Syntrophorhabdaceae bacterium PtaU1.Bin034]|nr:MAG: hypothetical protein A4E57_04037 [Syntrophorhabdaceae bacterium PtaU1.Bin034]
MCENQSDEQAEPSIPEDERGIGRLHVYLFKDFKGRSEGLGKNSLLIGHMVRDFPQVLQGKGNVLGKNPVATRYAYSVPCRAVPFHAPLAVVTHTASAVDLADNPFSDEPRVCPVHPFDHADKLVARNALEFLIPPGNLQVRSADTRHEHTDERFIVSGFRTGITVAESQRAVKHEGLHVSVYVNTAVCCKQQKRLCITTLFLHHPCGDMCCQENTGNRSHRKAAFNLAH